MATHDGIELRVTVQGREAVLVNTDQLLAQLADENLVPPGGWHAIVALGRTGEPAEIIVECRAVELPDIETVPDDASELLDTELGSEYHEKLLLRTHHVHDGDSCKISDDGICTITASQEYPESNWG